MHFFYLPSKVKKYIEPLRLQRQRKITLVLYAYIANLIVSVNIEQTPKDDFRSWVFKIFDQAKLLPYTQQGAGEIQSTQPRQYRELTWPEPGFLTLPPSFLNLLPILLGAWRGQWRGKGSRAAYVWHSFESWLLIGVGELSK